MNMSSFQLNKGSFHVNMGLFHVNIMSFRINEVVEVLLQSSGSRPYIHMALEYVLFPFECGLFPSPYEYGLCPYEDNLSSHARRGGGGCQGSGSLALYFYEKSPYLNGKSPYQYEKRVFQDSGSLAVNSYEKSLYSHGNRAVALYSHIRMKRAHILMKRAHILMKRAHIHVNECRGCRKATTYC